MALFDVSQPPYSAACNLVADDTIAVKSAINDANSSLDAASVVLIRYPGCRINGGGNGLGVGIGSNVTLEGELVTGQPRTRFFSSFLHPNGEGEAVFAVGRGSLEVPVNELNIRIQNLNIYNSATQGFVGGSGNGVGLINQGAAAAGSINGLTIVTCETHSRSHCGVVLQNAQNVLMQDCDVGGAYTGIYLAGARNVGVTVQSVNVKGTDVDPSSGQSYTALDGSVGISVRGVSNLTISNCHISGAWKHSGIAFRNEVSTGVQVTSNTIDCSADAAIVIVSAIDLNIRSNTISGATGSAIQLRAVLNHDCGEITIEWNSIGDPDPSATSAYAMVIAADTSLGVTTAGHFRNLTVSNNTCINMPQGINVDFYLLDSAGSANVLINDIFYDQGGATSPNPALYVLNMAEGGRSDYCCVQNNKVRGYYVPQWGSGVYLDPHCGCK